MKHNILAPLVGESITEVSILKWAKKNAPKIITVDTKLARKVFLGDSLTGRLGTPESAGFVVKTVEQLREVKTGGPEAGYDIAE